METAEENGRETAEYTEYAEKPNRGRERGRRTRTTEESKAPEDRRSPRRKRETKPAQPSQDELQEQLLAQIAYAASHCAEIERAFGDNPPPQTETLMNIYRVLILKLSGEAQVNPEQLKLAMSLLKPVLDWERFEDARKEREQAEQKERESQTAARSREAGEDALRPETLEQIERELSLL
jgi:hypothetical protein